MHLLAEKMHIFGGYDGNKPHNGDVLNLDIDDLAGMLSSSKEERNKENKS